MNHLKTFLHRIWISTTTAMLCVCLSMFTVPLTGCTITPAEVAADGQAISNALIAVGVVYPQASADLDKAAAAVVAATSNWQTGSVTADINTALGGAEAVLSAIPQTSAVAQLIPIAVAAIDILIAAIPPPPVAATANVSVPLAARAKPANPYKLTPDQQKALVHHRMGRSPAGDMKTAWNAKGESIGLPQAKIK